MAEWLLYPTFGDAAEANAAFRVRARGTKVSDKVFARKLGREVEMPRGLFSIRPLKDGRWGLRISVVRRAAEIAKGIPDTSWLLIAEQARLVPDKDVLPLLEEAA